MLNVQLIVVLTSFLVVLASSRPQQVSPPYYGYPDFGARYVPPKPKVAMQPLNTIRTADVPQGKSGPGLVRDSLSIPVPSTSSATNSVNSNNPAASGNDTNRQEVTSPTTTLLAPAQANGTESVVPNPTIPGVNPEAYVSTGIAILGAALGRTSCAQKAACHIASLIPPTIKGKEMIIIAAEPFVPLDWKAVYQAAKGSVMQKMDCDSFKCF